MAEPLIQQRMKSHVRDDGQMRESVMPSWMPAANRRVFNPVVRLGASWLPPLALVVHRGRRSGREYRTPVLAFRSGSTLAVVLFYGADVQWVRNVVAGGGGELIRGKRRSRFEDVRVVRDGSAPLPPGARSLGRRLPVLVARLDQRA
jgi:deazaflavin-dependent oxidoreductase (nitroreductase family)